MGSHREHAQPMMLNTFRTLLVSLLLSFAVLACAEVDRGGAPVPDTSVIEGDLTVVSAGDLSKLAGTGYFTLAGTLTIVGSELIDLSGLKNLRAIEGDLVVQANPFLTAVSGPVLERVDGHIIITGNPRLEHLGALRNLAELRGDLRIEDNPALRSLEGLNQLKLVAGSLVLRVLDRLGSMGALASLEIIGEDLDIEELTILSNIELAALERIGGSLRIVSNPALRSLSGLAVLKKVVELMVDGGVYIQGNSNLRELGLDSLAVVRSAVMGGEVLIKDNPELPEAAVNKLRDQVSVD